MRGPLFPAVRGFLTAGASLVVGTGSGHTGFSGRRLGGFSSRALERRLGGCGVWARGPAVCGVFPGWELNLCPPHWQVGSRLLCPPQAKIDPAFKRRVSEHTRRRLLLLVDKSCPTLCDIMHCSAPGFPVFPRAYSGSYPLSW